MHEFHIFYSHAECKNSGNGILLNLTCIFRQSVQQIEIVGKRVEFYISRGGGVNNFSIVEVHFIFD